MSDNSEQTKVRNFELDKFIEVAGVKIRYRERIGEAPPILFLHGITESLEFWALQLEAGIGDHRLIALDLPGHGKSGSPTSGPLTCPAMACQATASSPMIPINSPASWLRSRMRCRLTDFTASAILSGVELSSGWPAYYQAASWALFSPIQHS